MRTARLTSVPCLLTGVDRTPPQKTKEQMENTCEEHRARSNDRVKGGPSFDGGDIQQQAQSVGRGWAITREDRPFDVDDHYQYHYY